MLRRTLSSIARPSLVVLALAGCGGDDLPKAPQILPDRTTLGFGSDVGNAVYVGTSRIETLQLKNGGQDKLELKAPVITGPNAAFFTLDLSGTSIESGQKAYVQVTYKPTEPGKHTATLTVDSNAGNTPSLAVSLSAEAVKAP